MRRKIKFYKSLLIEIIETLCTICLYLESEGRYSHNQYSRYMRGHFNELKGFSGNLRGESNHWSAVYGQEPIVKINPTGDE